MHKSRIAPALRSRPLHALLRDVAVGAARVAGGRIVPRIAGGAAAPAFAATPNTKSGLVPGTADASLTAPVNATSIFTAGASGAKVDQIQCQGVGTTSAGVVNVFLYRGATYYLIDQFLVSAVTSSTILVAFQAAHTYENLILNAADEIRVTNTVAGNQSLIQVTAFGGDF